MFYFSTSLFPYLTLSLSNISLPRLSPLPSCLPSSFLPSLPPWASATPPPLSSLSLCLSLASSFHLSLSVFSIPTILLLPPFTPQGPRPGTDGLLWPCWVRVKLAESLLRNEGGRTARKGGLASMKNKRVRKGGRERKGRECGRGKGVKKVEKKISGME